MKKILIKYLSIKDKIGVIQKDSQNPFAKSKYASLPNMLKHINPVLTEFKVLFIPQFAIDENVPSMYKCSCDLIDCESEETMNFIFSVPFDDTQKNPVQGFGSSMTYGQRYVYGCVFGIAFDDDDPDSGKTKGANCEAKDTDKRKWLNPNTDDWTGAIKSLKSGKTIDDALKVFKISKDNQEKLKSESHGTK